ncbi:CII family transcriptional regulator [Pantoea rwandensis]|uniref:Regulatory protein n=1 Tax=Pantoea rwandensis TaxID=1076550 RepID=A0ABM5RM80_9GAMM|nr:CII family transcriptional regulator [Pantoea rwandensis]AIR87105.1 regulatory protein [Pantoea rwandensis]
MEHTQNRTSARSIESALLNKIAMKGSQQVAEAIGVDRSQITRWKETFIPKISMLLSVLEWGVVDDDLARLAKQVASLLQKQKSSTARTVEDSQITLNF